MDMLLETGKWFIFISLELSILFLVIGFVIGVIITYAPAQRIQSVLERHGRAPIGNALGVVFGGLLPFCSCSTIPVLVGLLNVGVPFSIAMSFLIAAPLGIFNLIEISLFSALFGFRVALAYIITTFVAAVSAGIVLNWLGLANQVKRVVVAGGNGNK